MIVEKFFLTLVVLIFDVLSILQLVQQRLGTTPAINHNHLAAGPGCSANGGGGGSSSDCLDGFNRPELLGAPTTTGRHGHRGTFVLLAEAKGVAGLGKAGGDGTGGADKAGTQVPPEVYNALTYAGTAFLFTLSVPLILYGLNKLLNKIEDCFGCGPASKKKKIMERRLENQQLFEQQQTQDTKLNDTNLSNNRYHHQQQQQHDLLSRQAQNQNHLSNYLQQPLPFSQPQLTDRPAAQVAQFPANKQDCLTGGSSNNSNNPNSSNSRQNSPAVPTTDSTALTLPLNLSQQQDYKNPHIVAPTTTAFQNTYHQPTPYIISQPHI